MIRQANERPYLGPCVGAVTPTTAKLWIHTPLTEGEEGVELECTIHEGSPDAPVFERAFFCLRPANLGCGVVTFTDLKPDTQYFYRIEGVTGFTAHELNFWTFPDEERLDKLDFLLLSCHDPLQRTDDGQDGYRMWSIMPQVKKQNDIRFAIFVGDQIYGDHVQEEVLRSRSFEEKVKCYLKVYHKLWSHPLYRKALCSIPTFLIWDDHDITDGWGSRSDSFVDAYSSEFRYEWLELFRAARKTYSQMQAIRNPDPLAEGDEAAFDFCFKFGRAGFVVADVRSNRNVRKKQVWRPEQFTAIKRWVAENKSSLDILFFVTPVVVSHGWPEMEERIQDLAPAVTAITQTLSKLPGFKDIRWMQRLVKRNIQDIGGFRDDLEDAWSSRPNAAQAEELLDFLYELQNPRSGERAVPVIILSGDIHAGGYSMIYSAKPEHARRPVIEHICSSPVSSKAMNWMVEGLYQQDVSAVPVGTSGFYSAQVSHHYCHRNLSTLSLRRFGEGELQLKIKFYLENRKEPVIIVSDLNRVSHREGVSWPQESSPQRGAA